MSGIAVGTALLAASKLAVEALKKIPSFDQKKLKKLEASNDLLAHGIAQEDSALILDSMAAIKNLSSTYKALL